MQESFLKHLNTKIFVILNFLFLKLWILVKIVATKFLTISVKSPRWSKLDQVPKEVFQVINFQDTLAILLL